jgi:signal transduction histidine kinase
MSRHLGDILLERGYISSQDLDRALAYQMRKVRGDDFKDTWVTAFLLEIARTKYNNRDQFYLGKILTELKLLPETQVLEALEIQRATPTVPPRGRLDALNRIIVRMNSSYSLIDLLNQVLVLGAQLVDAESASLIIHDHARDSLVILMPTGPGAGAVRDLEIPRDQGIVGWVYQNGRSVICNDTTNDRRFYAAIDSASGYTSRQILCVPLTVRDKKLGAIEALNKRPGSRRGARGFSPADRFLLEMFSAQAAIAIENTRLALALNQAQEDLSLRRDVSAAAQRTNAARLVADSFLEEMHKALVPLKGWSEKLREVAPDARVEKYRSLLDRELDRLLERAGDVKRFLADEFSPSRGPLSLRELLRELESRVWVECRTARIAFQVEADEDATLNADRGLLLKALEALFRNSREAMPDGGTFALRVRRPAPGTVEITASDTGPGIDADPIEMAFDPFYTSGKRHGAGLGLSMARRIVELHDGTLSAANAVPGAGSQTTGAVATGAVATGAVFTITLPVV